jgi:hypothetical protein
MMSEGQTLPAAPPPVNAAVADPCDFTQLYFFVGHSMPEANFQQRRHLRGLDAQPLQRYCLAQIWDVVALEALSKWRHAFIRSISILTSLIGEHRSVGRSGGHMKKLVCVGICCICLTVSSVAQKKFPDSCTAGTTGHFPASATAIDSKCGIQGTPSPKQPGDGPQNETKNNFCTKAAEPTTINAATVEALQGSVEQKQTEMKLKPGEPPSNRGFLKDLGEGDLVVFEGYVFHARQECGETVNCGNVVANVNASHDIHIALLETPRKTKLDGPKPDQDAEECTAFVAEMVPHHRPGVWTACNVNDVAAAGLKVRITGQRFFDGSHVPCKNGAPQGDNPKRMSLWEIHPIYAFEVCPSGDCAAGGWQPLEKFAAGKTSCAEVDCKTDK